MNLNDKFSEKFFIVDKYTGIKLFRDGFPNLNIAITQFNREIYKNPISASAIVITDSNNKIVYEVEE